MADSHRQPESASGGPDVGLILDPQGQAGLSVLAFAELEVGIVMRRTIGGAKALSLGELSRSGILCPARR
ncbi:hypothetical protein BANRA_00001 [Klebsiella pneumoniae]|nr:hypothetical protein BANRA_00001 [Klebsiella pneumoniae]